MPLVFIRLASFMIKFFVSDTLFFFKLSLLLLSLFFALLLLFLCNLLHESLDLCHLYVVALDLIPLTHLHLFDFDHWVFNHSLEGFTLLKFTKVDCFVILDEFVLTGVFLDSLSLINRLSHQVLLCQVLISLGDVLVHPIKSLETTLRNDALLNLLLLQILNLALLTQFTKSLLLLLVVFFLLLLSGPHLLNVAELFRMPRFLVQK